MTAREPSPGPLRYRLWCGGLYKDITEEEIRQKVEPFGDVIKVMLRSSVKDTFCFIQFRTQKDMDAAKAKLDQSNDILGERVCAQPATADKKRSGNQDKGKGKGGGGGYGRGDDFDRRPRSRTPAGQGYDDRRGGKGNAKPRYQDDFRDHQVVDDLVDRRRDDGRGKGRRDSRGRDFREPAPLPEDRDGRMRDRDRAGDKAFHRDGFRRDEPRRDEPRREERRREEPRRDDFRREEEYPRDDFRRDDFRRDDFRRDDFRRDDFRRDEPRREEPRREDFRREAPRERERMDRFPRDHRGPEDFPPPSRGERLHDRGGDRHDDRRRGDGRHPDAWEYQGRATRDPPRSTREPREPRDLPRDQGAVRDPYSGGPPPRSGSYRKARDEYESKIPHGRHRIIVENLPDDMTWVEFKDLGKDFGSSITFARTSQEKGMNRGMLEYKDRAHAENALHELDNRRVEGSNLRLRAYYEMQGRGPQDSRM